MVARGGRSEMSACAAPEADPFAEARAEYDRLEAFVGSAKACSMSHSDLERELEKRGRELLRQLMQAHVEVRGPGEAPSRSKVPTAWCATSLAFRNEGWRPFWERSESSALVMAPPGWRACIRSMRT